MFELFGVTGAGGRAGCNARRDRDRMRSLLVGSVPIMLPLPDVRLIYDEYYSSQILKVRPFAGEVFNDV